MRNRETAGSERAHGRARRAFGLGAVATALLILFGTLGSLHPAGDSFAVLRPVLSVIGLALSVALLVVGSRRAAVVAAIVPLVALVSLAPYWIADARVVPGGLTIYQKNLLYRSRDVSAIRDDILTTAPDLVTLEELHPNNDRILDELRAAYPAQVECLARDVAGSVAILSRFPFRDGSARCSETPGMASAVVETPDGPVTAVAIHFEWPWPHRQPGQVERLLGEIAALDGPVVLAGDFNMVLWSATVRRIERASGAEPVGRAEVTFPIGPGNLTGVSIDHVLAPGGRGTTTLRPLLGSDHRGVLAHVELPDGRDRAASVASVDERRRKATGL